MKIRIQDNSVRFRVTIRESETLLTEGIIESSTTMISDDSKQCCGKFIYGVIRQDHLDESSCEIKPGSIILLLSTKD